MELTFIDPGLEYMIDNIMDFQTDNSTAFWSGPLFHFYPQLDKEYASSLRFPDKRNYIKSILSEVYKEQKNIIDEKTVLYSRRWQKYRPQVTDALSEAFDCDCSMLFNDMKCNITLNPIAPRFLEDHSFDVFYLNSEKGAIGTAIHEIIHFVWFYVWNKVFRDSYDEYESPSLKWILSETVVESVMRDERLSSINPYFPRENGGCIYPYFFDMRVNGELIVDTLDKMYRSLSIEEFMKRSYEYCLKYEDEIRAHIMLSESHV